MQARFGPYGEPAVVLNYGQSGVGKSMDLLRTFPDALFLAPPGGVKPAIRELGYSPVVAPVRTLYDCLQIAEQVISTAAAASRFTAICVDDATVLAQATYTAMEDSGRYRTSSGYTDGRRIYGDLGQLIIRFRDRLRYAGLHAALNFHEREPGTDDKGQFCRGGPLLPSRNQTAHIPHIGDLVVRARDSAGRLPWKGVALCNPDATDWFQKDRFGCAPLVGPLNTGELLRAAGYPIRRLAGLEWQEEAAQKIAEAILAGQDRLEAMSEWAARLCAKVSMPQARWAIQDGLDRAEIRTLRATEDLGRLGIRKEGDKLVAGTVKRSPFG